MLYPFVFHPIFKQRVWGGRKIETLYRKCLPPRQPIGESWEISDRPGDVSVIANGPLAGKDLRWLMEYHRKNLLGSAEAVDGRFPLLIKILDAEDMLSLQVHPPAHRALELRGEPKTEMWYIADAASRAELFAGLKRGVSRQQFENKLRDGSVAECFHRIQVHSGDAMFLPSGRVHAIGAGLVIFEIQQNSDTTYRVFDWNRKGLDGKLRELHVDQALASIDFDDFEPALVSSETRKMGSATLRPLVESPLFKVHLVEVKAAQSIHPDQSSAFRIVGVVHGHIRVAANAAPAIELEAGSFCLIPANEEVKLDADSGTKSLMITPGTL